MNQKERCGAKTRANGKCKRWPARYGNGRCKLHNGHAARGVLASNFKDGRYSDHLPDRLLERYETARTDPRLLELDAEIHLVFARLTDVLGRTERGESGQLWKLVRGRLDQLREAMNEGDKAGAILHFGELSKLVNRGIGDYAAWAEASRLIDQRRKLVESQRKRELESQTMMSADQSMLMVYRLEASVTKRVGENCAPDIATTILRGISDDLRAIYGVHADQRAIPR